MQERVREYNNYTRWRSAKSANSGGRPKTRIEGGNFLIAETGNALKVRIGLEHGLRATTTKDPTNHGIITHATVKDKIEFYKTTQQNKHKSTVNKNLTFKDNLTFEERIIEQKLGYVKYHLINDAHKVQNNIKIYWNSNRVALNGKKVAWYTNGKWKSTKAVDDIKELIEESISKWIQKRTQEPPTDSD